MELVTQKSLVVSLELKYVLSISEVLKTWTVPLLVDMDQTDCREVTDSKPHTRMKIDF